MDLITTHSDSKRGLLIVPTVLLLLGSLGCQWLKKTDNSADAQASAITSATAAPAASPVSAIASIAAEVPSVATAVGATHTQVAPLAKPKATAANSASATPAASATPTATAASGASATGSAAPAAATASAVAVNSQCLATCQKGYQTCTSEAGTLTGVDLVRKCRSALVPCLSACK
jgi:hypothetical protein